jgi:hypothetical protein
MEADIERRARNWSTPFLLGATMMPSGTPLTAPRWRPHMWSQMAAVRPETHRPDATRRTTDCCQLRPRAEHETPNTTKRSASCASSGQVRGQLNEHVVFASDLDEIRPTYRAERNLMKLLAAAG